MIRGSESAEHTLSTSIEPHRLNKQAFVERVHAKARRWQQPFRLSHLNEFIKQGLIERAVRQPNDGRKPHYTFGCRHYRRVLQLLRLRAVGVRDSDALIVQLFMRGYGIKTEQFRAAIVKEAERAATMLSTSIRSTYADRAGRIPPGRKRSLLAQIGDQDERFKGGQYGLDPSLALDFVRIARAAPPHESETPSMLTIPSELEPIARLVAGLLMPTDRQSADKTIIAMTMEAACQSLLAEAQTKMANTIAELRVQARSEAHTSDRMDCQLVVANWWRREFLAMTFIATLNALAQNRGHGTGASGSNL